MWAAWAFQLYPRCKALSAHAGPFLHLLFFDSSPLSIGFWKWLFCAPLQVFHSLCNGSLLSETKQAEASCLQSSREQAVWLQQEACHNFTYISKVWSIKNIYNSISRHSHVYRSSPVHILFLQMLNSVPLVQRKLQFFLQVYVAWWCKLSECLFSKINVFTLIKSP